MARSIEVPGLSHGGAPIPQASAVGNLLVSGGISPTGDDGEMPHDAESQVALVFANAVRVVQAAGGTAADIVKVTVFATDRAIRPIVDQTWLELFPHPDRRPARHTLRVDLTAPMLIQLEVIAVIGGDDPAGTAVKTGGASVDAERVASHPTGSGDPSVARLIALDSCSVSDALDKLGIDGAVTGLLPLTVARRVAGRAVPVQLGRPDVDGPPRRHLGTAAVDASTPGSVIVVAHQGRMDCAGWGGLLSRAAASKGVEGVLVDGAARDLGEAAAFDLPVYAAGEVPATARGRAVEVAWGEAIVFGGVEVSPGDMILADRGGVVVVPASRETEVLDSAERIAAIEAVMASAIDRGVPVSEVMDGSYEEMLSGDR